VIEEKRLRNLVEISKSSRLAKHVKRLEIHTLHLLPYNDFTELEASFDLNEEYPMRRFKCGSSDLSESEYAHLFEKQQKLMESGFASRCLSKIMSGLSSCKTTAKSHLGPGLIWNGASVFDFRGLSHCQKQASYLSNGSCV
jgi:hypothetical protein